MEDGTQDEAEIEAVAEPEPEPQKPGYLHTYAPTRPLKLLYIDGMSAGKTSNGTLDSQDILLLNLTTPAFDEPPPDHDGARPRAGGPMGEIVRAEGLCNLTKTLWGGKIDGIIRMEGGFEIIFCNIENLEVVNIMPVVNPSDGPGGHNGMLGGWQYYKAITERYHGIGGGRVVLDYENFVTAFSTLR